MGLPELLAGAMLASLVLYGLLGGADFGGGFWDLLATGPRTKAQRALIDRAIAPVWEANHVWLVLIVVILFSAFPAAFSTASIELHVPLTLLLVGIVLRGSAFVFRKYDLTRGPSERRWGHVFSLSSVFTPLFLGISLGAVTSGRLDQAAAESGTFRLRFIEPWLHVFPLMVGFFAVGLFAFLAAVYLTVEAASEGRALQDDFRKRAMASAWLVLVLAAVTALGPASPDMADVREKLVSSPWTWVLVASAAIAWGTTLRALSIRRFLVARAAAIALGTIVMLGWAFGQYPYLIRPDITIRSAAAPAATLELLAIGLAVGAVFLIPSLFWLLRVFKRPVERP
jgi:cytochrome d ubiquinol oxidase subunit II